MRKPRWCPRCREWRDWVRDQPNGGSRPVRVCVTCKDWTLPKPPAPKPPRRSRPARVRRTRKGGLTNACDVLFSRIVRARDQVCQDKGAMRPVKNTKGEIVAYSPHRCHGPLQCAHLVSRSYRATRWHLHNAVGLCAGAHAYYTYKHLEWDDWCKKRLGVGRWEDLRTEAKEGNHKLDLDKVLTTLRVEAERMGIR